MVKAYSWNCVVSLLVAGCWVVVGGTGCDRGNPKGESVKEAEPVQTETTALPTTSTESTAELPGMKAPIEETPLAAGKASDEATRPSQSATRPAGPTVPAWQPLLDAKPGEWAEYETLEGRKIRYQVMTVAPSGIEAQISIQEAGRSWGEPAKRDENAHDDPIAKQAERREAIRSVKSDSIAAAGHDWKATLYEDRWTDEEVQYIRRTWVSKEVPYHGIIRMELTGDGQAEARLNLVAYGKK